MEMPAFSNKNMHNALEQNAMLHLARPKHCTKYKFD